MISIDMMRVEDCMNFLWTCCVLLHSSCSECLIRNVCSIGSVSEQYFSRLQKIVMFPVTETKLLGLGGQFFSQSSYLLSTEILYH